MTALAAAVAIGDNQLLIDAPFAAGQVPCWVKIDTEMLYAGGQHFRTGTTLTLSAPATATHSNGATVTYAGRPYDADFRSATGGVGGGAIAVTGGGTTVEDVTEIDLGAVPVTDEGGGVAGVAVQTRLLGPFAVAFDDPGVDGAGGQAGVELTTLPQGAVVIRAWPFLSEAWVSAGATSIGMQLMLEAVSGNLVFAEYNVWDNTAIIDEPDVRIQSDLVGLTWIGQPLTGVVPVKVRIAHDGAASSAGQADVYVLIAEPVA